jgi:hypothetical protein
VRSKPEARRPKVAEPPAEYLRRPPEPHHPVDDRTNNQQPTTKSGPRPAAADHPVATATRTLRIELRESDDEDADRDRLDRVLAALRDFPGDDEVRFTVRTLDGTAHQMALGKLRVRTCAELTARLTAILESAGAVSAS